MHTHQNSLFDSVFSPCSTKAEDPDVGVSSTWHKLMAKKRLTWFGPGSSNTCTILLLVGLNLLGGPGRWGLSCRASREFRQSQKMGAFYFCVTSNLPAPVFIINPTEPGRQACSELQTLTDPGLVWVFVYTQSTFFIPTGQKEFPNFTKESPLPYILSLSFHPSLFCP